MDVPAYWGESRPAAQHATTAYEWQQRLGARWSMQEAWQTRCGRAVRLPPRVTPLVATKACTTRQLAPLLHQLARRRGVLRYSPEMDWRYHGTPTAFIRRWRRVYHAAHKLGVRVLWSATGLGMRNGRAYAYWPGRHHVDLVGWTMLQWRFAPRHVHALNRRAARFARHVHRRVLIPELGTARSLPDHLRAWWLRRAKYWLRRWHATGVVYLNSRAPGGDWRLDGSPRATRAWKAMR
jgi:hypothetical protein